MKRKGLLIAVGVVLGVTVMVCCVVLLLHMRNTPVPVVEETFSPELYVGAESETYERPIALDDEMGDEESDSSGMAEFDYSGYEYWQQNVLNTIAKTISDCQDNETVKILEITEDGGVGHMKVMRDGVVYETDFDLKSFAIISE